VTAIPLYLLAIGFSGRAINAARTLWQLRCTRKAGEPRLTLGTLAMGTFAILLLLIYYVAIGEPVGIVGYVVGIGTNLFNLYYAIKARKSK
jgi:lipid-A-disaccharide synthase-like uncharacterized protein